jgi:hypothetical protein
MGWDLALNKKRISNIEQGISKAEAIWQGKYFIIRNSLFDIRYSFQAHGKFIILELPAAEELAKRLLFLSIFPQRQFSRLGVNLYLPCLFHVR